MTLPACPECQKEHEPLLFACPDDVAAIVEKQGRNCNASYKAGTKFGGYKLIEYLHRGHRGHIFSALELESGQKRAIKLIHLNNVTDVSEAIKICDAEARTTANVAHPNVIGIFEAGNSSFNRPFMALEFVDGVSLASYLRLRQGPLNAFQFDVVFSSLLLALAHIHDEEMVHRALLPHHILISNSEPSACKSYPGSDENFKPTVKLIDFSNAKNVDGPEPPAPTVNPASREEQSTLQFVDESDFDNWLYSSPERCLAQPADARSDLYSLGCLMYLCMTGSPPFMGHSKVNTMQMHMAKVPMKIQEMRPDPESFGTPGRSPATYERVEKVIFTAMEKKPENRFQSAEEMLDALNHALSGA